MALQDRTSLSPFRNQYNQRMIQALFYEESEKNIQFYPLYTLKDRDLVKGDKVYPSLYRLYMSENDLTEYLVATKYTDGWEHWQMLCRASFFKPYITRWREELSLKIKAQALQRLQEVAKDSSGKNYTEVNKYLANEAWKTSQANLKRGRPTKTQIQDQVQQAWKDSKDIQSDFDRVMGVEEYKLNTVLVEGKPN